MGRYRRGAGIQEVPLAEEYDSKSRKRFASTQYWNSASNTETIAVQAEAVAIRTESADITTTVSNQMFVELPIQWSNGFYGNQAVRNPLSVAQILPGMSGGTSYFNSLGLTGGGASINGQPTSTFKALVDGQDSTNLYTPSFFFYQQPSVEALEEVSLQTGNYSAEFGQAQGGIYNFTAKSGTNQYHGGAFYRLTNEDLNAHQPYTGSRAAQPAEQFRRHLRRPRSRFPICITATTRPSSSSRSKAFAPFFRYRIRGRSRRFRMRTTGSAISRGTWARR